VITDAWLSDTRDSYDTVADSYADLYRTALAERPYERAVLALFAELVETSGGGPVADVGCGPGHLTAHLRELDLDAFGIDLSPRMVDVARSTYPDLRFEVGSMTDLAPTDASLAGLLSWYVVHHAPDHVLPPVFEHFHRVLRPGGVALVGFHHGNGSRLKTQGYGEHPMRVHIHRRTSDDVATLLRNAGFTVEARLVLDPVDQGAAGAGYPMARRGEK
jgi:SAM-dependent methyltransferase